MRCSTSTSHLSDKFTNNSNKSMTVFGIRFKNSSGCNKELSAKIRINYTCFTDGKQSVYRFKRDELIKEKIISADF